MATLNPLTRCFLFSLLPAASFLQAQEPVQDFLREGQFSGDFRLRYDFVSQESFDEDAHALTLRSALEYRSKRTQGVAFTLGIEDSRPVFGMDDYSVPQTDFNSQQINGTRVNEFPVIPDPQHTELEKASIEYKNATTEVILGRQPYVIDNHRFLDSAGWRQDNLTYDALSVKYQAQEHITFNYAFFHRRNLPFGDARDVKSRDHIVNVGYKTPFGKISSYAYLLKNRETDVSLNTFGIRFQGAAKFSSIDRLQLISSVEYATQEQGDFIANYLMLESGLKYDAFTASAGQEFLGSAEGAYGFSTPVGAVHGFNGWADVFVNTPQNGLKDLYLRVKGDFGQRGKAVFSFHDFTAAEENVPIGHYGREIDFSYSLQLDKHISTTFKIASYKSDSGASVIAPDTDKVWLWVNASF